MVNGRTLLTLLAVNCFHEVTSPSITDNCSLHAYYNNSVCKSMGAEQTSRFPVVMGKGVVISISGI
jgi:hypothetical protein